MAALMVAVSHSFVALSFGAEDQIWSRPIWTIPLDSIDALCAGAILILANGSAAVTIFFVLSGVVLGMSLDSSAVQLGLKRSFFAFWVKRIFRIYPAHIVVLILVCVTQLLWQIINPGNFGKASVWYNWFYLNLPDFDQIIKNLFLQEIFINPVTWTLKVEVVVALIFPVLHLISRTEHKWRASLQLLVLTLLIGLAIVNHGGGMVLPHLYKFYLGLLLPVYGKIIAKMLAATRLVMRSPAILIFSIFLLSFDHQLDVSFFKSYGLMESVGAALLIYTMMQNSYPHLFGAKKIKKLGKCSYSFYLLHFPLLWFVYFALHSNTTGQKLIEEYTFFVATFVCALTISMAYLAASMNYRLVEYRMILFGRELAVRLAGNKSH